MPLQTDVFYFQVAGSRVLPDGQNVQVYLEQVADFQGAPLPPGVIGRSEVQMLPLAQDPARGIIIKVTFFSGRTIQVNPTS